MYTLYLKEYLFYVQELIILPYFSDDDTISNVIPFFFNSSIKDVFINAAPGDKTPPLKKIN